MDKNWKTSIRFFNKQPVGYSDCCHPNNISMMLILMLTITGYTFKASTWKYPNWVKVLSNHALCTHNLTICQKIISSRPSRKNSFGPKHAGNTDFDHPTVRFKTSTHPTIRVGSGTIPPVVWSLHSARSQKMLLMRTKNIQDPALSHLRLNLFCLDSSALGYWPITAFSPWTLEHTSANQIGTKVSGNFQVWLMKGKIRFAFLFSLVASQSLTCLWREVFAKYILSNFQVWRHHCWSRLIREHAPWFTLAPAHCPALVTKTSSIL